VILPGATLGLLGGGQLGRMFTVAARTLGYRVTVSRGRVRHAAPRDRV
jgi:5-(carboxyamino)imidazole ribonucleotide synthase